MILAVFEYFVLELMSTVSGPVLGGVDGREVPEGRPPKAAKLVPWILIVEPDTEVTFPKAPATFVGALKRAGTVPDVRVGEEPPEPPRKAKPPPPPPKPPRQGNCL